ncbi:hypothetical protein M885DRAFT_588431 [Pelagophyceae sp. CCMP2097]|nr:hypothetical protein M885DRAFT_588431 [Pelagophyceae sp. CCMP2097]
MAQRVRWLALCACALAVVPTARRGGPRATRLGATRSDQGATRRGFFNGAAFLSLAALAPPPATALTKQDVLGAAIQISQLGTSRPYKVTGAGLQAVNAMGILDRLTGAGVVWIGRDREASGDDELQAQILAALAVASAAQDNQVGVGLEAVGPEFQKALDRFTAGDSTLEGLRFETQWDAHWPYSIERYEATLELCKTLRMPLVAMGPRANRVEKGKHFKRRTAPYATTRSAGAPAQLWDEAVSERAAAWVNAPLQGHASRTLVALIGEDRVSHGWTAAVRTAAKIDSPVETLILNPPSRLPAVVLVADNLVDGALAARPAAFAAPSADYVWFSSWSGSYI